MSRTQHAILVALCSCWFAVSFLADFQGQLSSKDLKRVLRDLGEELETVDFASFMKMLPALDDGQLWSAMVSYGQLGVLLGAIFLALVSARAWQTSHVIYFDDFDGAIPPWKDMKDRDW